VPIDIYSSYSGPGGIVCKSSSIVVNKWYNDAGIPGGIYNILHVLWVERFPVSKVSVLILGLVENDRTPAGDLVLCDYSGNVVDIARNKPYSAMFLENQL
jgi:hypothetical protein